MWLVTPTSHMENLLQVLAALLPMQLSANKSAKALGDDPRVQAPAARWEARVEFQAPGSCLAQPQFLWPFGK